MRLATLNATTTAYTNVLSAGQVVVLVLSGSRGSIGFDLEIDLYYVGGDFIVLNGVPEGVAIFSFLMALASKKKHQIA